MILPLSHNDVWYHLLGNTLCLIFSMVSSTLNLSDAEHVIEGIVKPVGWITDDDINHDNDNDSKSMQ